MAGKKKTERSKKTAAKSTAVEATHRPFSALKKAGLPAPPPARARIEDKKAPRASPLDTEELDFAERMRGVLPLDEKLRGRVPQSGDPQEPVRKKPPPKPQGEHPEDVLARAKLQALVLSELRFEVIDDGSVIEGRRLDVEPRELGRLRRGSYPVDGKLDLHGKNAVEARREVETFVRRRRLQGDRVVLIVHGKGKHSAGGSAVLRGELGAWLSQGHAMIDVLAFTSLLDSDDESGALLVRLGRPT